MGGDDANKSHKRPVWSLEGTEEFGYAIRTGGPSAPITDNVRGLANARLITKAPAMYEAIAEIECLDCGHTLKRHVDKYGCMAEVASGAQDVPCGCTCTTYQSSLVQILAEIDGESL